MSLDDATRAQIDSLVGSNPVMLFMKGNRQAPQCGFSATIVQILDQLTADYATADVLADPALRDGIKAYSEWPTVPQLYVKGEFIGGCDIVQELFATTELHAKLGLEIDVNARPEISITDGAAKALRAALANADDGSGRELHLAIDARFQSELAMAPRAPSDIEITSNGIELLIDALGASRADGLTIDVVEAEGRTGFRIENPNAPNSPSAGD